MSTQPLHQQQRLALLHAIVTSWRDGRELSDSSLDHEYVQAVTHSADGACLAASLTTNTIKTYQCPAMQFMRELKGHAHPITALRSSSTHPQVRCCMLHARCKAVSSHSSLNGMSQWLPLHVSPHSPHTNAAPVLSIC